FERFSNYVVISNILNEDFDDPNAISTGNIKGIDGIGIIVNNQVIKDESELEKITEREKINIKISFIQSTTASSFDLKKFQLFIDEVVNFLTGSTHIEPFSDIIKKIFDEEGRFIEQISETPSVELYYCSARTNHKLEENELENAKNKILNRNDFLFKFNLKGIFFLQNNELKEYYDNIDKFLETLIEFNSQIILEEKKDIPISFVSVLKFSELRKIIISPDGYIKEKIFVENVRSKIKDSNVNEDIYRTLKDDSKRPYFVYLNNGITILCESIRSHEVKRNKYYLKYPRIINGCQTSHMIYKYYLENKSEADNVELIAKIISTTNAELKKNIIYATNNQNAIDQDLEALNIFHTKLEEYFISKKDIFDIYFERLRGQYSDVNPPYKIINKETIAKSYISIILQEPHLMKSNAISKIEKYREEKKIFNFTEEQELEKYYYCGVLYYLMNNILSNNIIQLKSKTMDMHLLLACDLKLTKDGLSSFHKKLEYLSHDENVKNLFKEVNEILEKQDYLYEARGFYSTPKTKRLIEYFNKL
ncbi:MAG: AIPR family protein, partial [Chitinispirillaceae bacterium]|nr:AIPR family protein [Chitinispirillaceae bacterium]